MIRTFLRAMELVMTGSDALDLTSGGLSSTFFVPTDAAFDELGASTIDEALGNRALLKTVSWVSKHHFFIDSIINTLLKMALLFWLIFIRLWPTMSFRVSSIPILSGRIWSTSCLRCSGHWPSNESNRFSKWFNFNHEFNFVIMTVECQHFSWFFRWGKRQ